MEGVIKATQKNGTINKGSAGVTYESNHKIIEKIAATSGDISFPESPLFSQIALSY